MCDIVGFHQNSEKLIEVSIFMHSLIIKYFPCVVDFQLFWLKRILLSKVCEWSCVYGPSQLPLIIL